ncbi:MAG TPA: ferritin-like domain-containing protein [Dehalococcoidia bacterium]|nr:ferritin-like domain-containing protein [Dehalococcoidia bacterium]
MNDHPFLSDIKELRRRAQENIDQGAVTSEYGRDINQALRTLNQVLASELVCVLRYKHHYYMAKGIHAEPVAAEFLQHANDEQEHADRVAQRITQLGGDPDFNPEGILTRSASQYGDSTSSLIGMIKEDLVAERVVIMWYGEIVRWFGDNDPTSRRMMEDLLAQEEDHADDLADLLVNLDVAVT